MFEPAPPEPAENVTTKKDTLLRYVLVLAAIVLSITILYMGKALILMLLVACIFSFLLLPISRWLERKRFPKWASALTGTLLLLASVIGLFAFFGWQYSSFGNDLPALKQAVTEKADDLQAWIADNTSMSRKEQGEWLNKELDMLGAKGGDIVMGTLSATGGVIANIIPIPIFVFFLLLMRDKFRIFFSQLSGDHSDTILRVVTNISELSRKWLKGVTIVMLVLSVLNAIGFLILGLKYAILLAVTAAVLNIVPYVGPWIGALMPMGIALLTKDNPLYAVGALGVILTTQFIENNFVTPKVVGSSVSINPLASLVALFAGGMLWGVIGLILAIPITGMLKIVCDEIPGLKPWGFLIGEEKVYPEEGRIYIPFVLERPSPRSTDNPPAAPMA